MAAYGCGGVLELVALFAGVELKRKKLRLRSSALFGAMGDLPLDWLEVEALSRAGLFSRRYDRLDDESEMASGWLTIDGGVRYAGGDLGESGDLRTTRDDKIIARSAECSCA